MHGKKQERAYGGCLWLRKAMKDVASCEKPRVGAGDLRSADVRMGQPTGVKLPYHCSVQ